jgi:hypothetical protein
VYSTPRKRREFFTFYGKLRLNSLSEKTGIRGIKIAGKQSFLLYRHPIHPVSRQVALITVTALALKAQSS